MKDTSETSPVGKSPKDERPQGKRRLSIFWRCTITNTLIYSLVFLLAVSLFMLFIGLRTWKNCEKTIRALRAELVVELRGARRYDTLWITLAHLKLPQGAAYRVMDKEGMILAETTTYLPFPLEGEETEILVNQSEEGEGQRYTTLESADWTATADGEVLLQVSYDITWFREIVEAVLFWMLIFFPFILLISLLVSYITTRISFGAVRDLSQKFRKITPAPYGLTDALDTHTPPMV